MLGANAWNLRRRISGWAVRKLSEPISVYSPSEVTNLRALKKRARPGDVFLVSGNARISHVVKILTLSQWSHVVLYIGDRSDLATEDEKRQWRKEFGNNSLKHLVIDADPIRRVHLRPVDEYVGLMMRHCRPEALKSEDLDIVIDHALSQLGKNYDITHIIRLLFFFAFPLEILPESMRRFTREFALSETDRICSRVLSDAFHSVGFPIRPLEIVQHQDALHNRALNLAFGLRHRSKSALKLVTAGKLNQAMKRLTNKKYLELHLKTARHITPADYDLSRFFSVIKDSSDLAIDYRNATTLCPIPVKRDWE